MPSQDADRWNDRYLKDGRYATFVEPRPFLVENARFLPLHGAVLDLAMGLGGNAAFLLERGLRVVGVDISEVAVRQAKARLPGLQAVVADLEQFYLPPASFDVLLNFFYLQRDWWPRFARLLRPGGVVFIETLTTQMCALLPDTDPLYLLEPGELLHAFAGWQVLAYHEGWDESRQGRPRACAGLIAQSRG